MSVIGVLFWLVVLVALAAFVYFYFTNQPFRVKVKKYAIWIAGAAATLGAAIAHWWQALPSVGG